MAAMFSGLGRELATLRSVEEVFATISLRAFHAIPAAEHAAISLGRDGVFQTVGATSDLPPKVDQIQYELGTGPCVDASLDDTSYRCGDLRQDARWPEFGRRAAEEYGVVSMLSVRLYLEDDDPVAALNLYASAPGAFDTSDQTTATMLAAHGALGYTAARRQDKITNLEYALRSSRRIGAAIGILMATYRVTDEHAFGLLRIASQAGHRKLADVAEDVVETGALDLPPLPEERRRPPSG